MSVNKRLLVLQYKDGSFTMFMLDWTEPKKTKNNKNIFVNLDKKIDKIILLTFNSYCPFQEIII
ncbi:hypothetical protein BpHYR1_013751 [Brachionus plicatilis]|uniref:Uncharacterized protein n=1 Tax=Brachionus plicatilis TaxID=10195 RepID=A0A3M7PAD6_BRAPC|nr:hypothetical protein BpHYR1_013751 [Brachionus plicatilis]